MINFVSVVASIRVGVKVDLLLNFDDKFLCLDYKLDFITFVYRQDLLIFQPCFTDM